VITLPKWGVWNRHLRITSTSCDFSWMLFDTTSRVTEFTPSLFRVLVFCTVFCESLFVFLYFIISPLYCLFFSLQLLVIPIVLSVLLVTASGYPHCIVCSSRYSFWLSPLYFKWVFFQQYFYCIVAVSFIDGL
jgi:hypothetical protein